MKIGPWLKSNIGSGRELVGSGLEGANTAWKAALDDQKVTSAVTRMARNSWKVASIGAVVGIVGAYVSSEKRSTRGAVVGGLLGASVGFGGAMAWGTRDLVKKVASGALQSVSTVRDERWLAKHPITYG